LAVEEQYYLIWPLIFWFWRKDLRRLSWIIAGMIGLVWAHRAILHFVVHVDQGYIYRAFDTRFDHLLVGCLLAVVLRAGFLRRLWMILCGSFVVPFLTLGLLVLSISIGVKSTMYRNVIGFAIDPILVAVVLVQLFVYRKSFFCSWLNSPIPVYLGTISYSLYLYQELTLFTARRLTAQYPVWVQFAVAVLSTVVMASASYWIIEKPFLRLKNRIAAPRETTTPQVAWSVESC
jgi:peptidoglycan/LPS O-acetylase OafA/YrhL